MAKKFYVSELGLSNRLYIEIQPTDLSDPLIMKSIVRTRTVLDALCIWGGSDKIGEQFECWEFSPELDPKTLTFIGNRLGYMQETDYAAHWLNTLPGLKIKEAVDNES